MLGKKSSLGISVTDGTLQAAKLQYRKGELHIEALHTETLREGTLQDGKIVNEVQLSQAISRVVAQCQARRMNVQIALPSALTLVRYLSFPDVPARSLRKLIDFEVKQNMFLPFNDPYYDYIKLPKSQDQQVQVNKQVQKDGQGPEITESGQNKPITKVQSDEMREEYQDHDSNKNPIHPESQVMLVTASEAMIKQYIKAFKSAQLNVKSIELDAFSLYRLLSMTESDVARKTLMTVNIAREQSDISVIQNGYVIITRTLPLSFAEEDETTHHHAYQQIVSEIERIISFCTYSMNNRVKDIDKIFVFGGGSQLNDIVSHIQSRLNNEVARMDNSSILWEDASEEADAYAVPLGLCLRGYRIASH